MFIMPCEVCFFLFFFFNDTATTEIYTLSLHDALPISPCGGPMRRLWWSLVGLTLTAGALPAQGLREIGRAPRLNSSHGYISYAVFCLKKKRSCSYEQQQMDRSRPAAGMLQFVKATIVF